MNFNPNSMAKVVTLTFNPCIDKNTVVSDVLPEKKLRCSSPTFAPGGGGINVSRALKNLGQQSVAIYPIGGHTGYFLLELMTGEGIASQIVRTNSFTRENLIVVEESSSKQFRFGMPGNQVPNEYADQLIELVEKHEADFLVVSGSLLPGMSVDVIARVAEIAKKKNSKLVLDTSGEALKRAVEVGVYLLKPNLNELSSLVGKTQLNAEEADDVARRIIAKGMCEMVAVSMGETGAKLITKDQVYFAESPKVDTISTLGAGDSMVAGMVYALANGFEIADVLKFGIACGTAATISPGTELCQKKDVDSIYNQMSGTA